jgi:hypothetical protein
MGALGTRLSLRPLLLRAAKQFCKTRAPRAARSRSYVSTSDVIARSEATKQSILNCSPMDCFACARNDGVETRATPTAVIARLDRAIQYSRDDCDGIEKPRRTGYPACAEYDGRGDEERSHEIMQASNSNAAAPRVARKGEAWWGRKDSNLRSHKTADLQSAPFATRDTSPQQHRDPTAGTAEIRAMMTLKPRTRSSGSRSGAFMGEAPRQSQPTQAANMRRDGLKLPLFGTHDTSLP